MIWIIFIVTAVISFAAMARLKSVYHEYLAVETASGLTGAQVAQRILDAADIQGVEIVAQDGMLGDHYDPMNKRLVLSQESYGGTSIASIGVAAHECGHAIQHKIAYAPLEWRMASVGITTFASSVVTWLPLVGLFTGFLAMHTALWIMAAAWGVIMLFNLITLPVEFDASRRAKIVLSQMGIVNGEEAAGVSRMLDAAAMTYVAAFLTSLLYTLYYLLPLLMDRRND